MGVPASEVGYTTATTGRGDHEVHKGHVVALEKITLIYYNARSTAHLVYNIPVLHELITNFEERTDRDFAVVVLWLCTGKLIR
jgi:hypothetical protein